jgi:hypothetical protein
MYDHLTTSTYLDMLKYESLYFSFWIFLQPAAFDFGHNMNQYLVYHIGL